GDVPEEIEGPALRVRVPRRQRGDERHARRRTCEGAQQGRGGQDVEVVSGFSRTLVRSVRLRPGLQRTEDHPMSRSMRLFGALVVAVAVASLATPLGAQSAKPAAKPTAKAWTPPRGPDGHADISGVWSHNAATPFERPKELEGREYLTEQEVANLK